MDTWTEPTAASSKMAASLSYVLIAEIVCVFDALKSFSYFIFCRQDFIVLRMYWSRLMVGRPYLLPA